MKSIIQREIRELKKGSLFLHENKKYQIVNFADKTAQINEIKDNKKYPAGYIKLGQLVDKIYKYDFITDIMQTIEYWKLEYIRKKKKKEKEKLLRPRWCSHCKHRIKINYMKEHTVEVHNEVNNTVEMIRHSGLRFGCSSSKQYTKDFVSGDIHEVYQNCETKNKQGKCKAYEKKWWILYIGAKYENY